MVFTTPAVRALRRQFREAHISYLVESAAAPIVATNPHIDEVIIAPRRAGFGSEARLVRRLRSATFDVAIDFHGGPRASLLTWLSGAPIRVGYEVAGRSWMYTRRVGRPRELRARHSVLNQWDLLTPFGIEPHDPTRTLSRCALIPRQRVGCRAPHAGGIAAGDRLAVVHVSAGNPFRRWPIDPSSP